MKTSRFSEEQKIGILKEVRAGSTIKAVCAAHNIVEQTCKVPPIWWTGRVQWIQKGLAPANNPSHL